MWDEKIDRRHATRVAFKVRATLTRVLEGMISQEAAVIDFSGLGSRFEIEPNSIYERERLKIEFHLPGQALPLVVYGRVIWVRNEGQGTTLGMAGVYYTNIAAKEASHFCQICGDALVEQLNTFEPRGSW